jgi:hypothetical protein
MPNPLNVPITPPRVAFIDPRTNNVSREWYMFFLSLFSLSGGSSVSLDDVQKGPPSLTVDELTLFIDKAIGNLNPAPGTSELQAELNTVRQELQLIPRQELGTMAQLQQANLPWVTFDTTPEHVPTDIGTVAWDGGTTLGIQMTANVLQRVGESQYFYIKADSTITKGQLIMFTGAVGASGVIKGAPATGLTDGQYLMGIAAENIAANGFGLVTSFGNVRGWNTTGAPVGETWADGDILYYNPLVAGGLTKTQPTAPNVKATVAVVVNAAPAGSGDVFVRVSTGSVLGGTDSNVQFGPLVNKDFIQYDSALQYWKNVAPGALTKIDDTNVTLTLGGSPTSALLAATSLTLGWTGQLAVGRGGTGVSTTPTNGQLLIGNGTGYTVANLTAGTNISITNSAGGITINSSNPGGTVTSVGLSAPTGFAVSGSPVTSSGTLALSFAAGYSLPTTASQSNWDTAYSERLQWDGGSTNLVAATGRTSLGATTVGSNLFTLTNPSAITFLRVNADNTVSALDAATFRTAIGAGTGNGTVTSVAALTIGTTGTDLSSTVANGTTTPVITLNVPTASASNRGALSSTDWTTFNNKQAALVSGTNIKTVNGTTLLGSGDLGTIGVAYGGTGLTSVTANRIPYGNGTSALQTSANLTFDGTNLKIGSKTMPTVTGGQVELIGDCLIFAGDTNIGSPYTQNLQIDITWGNWGSNPAIALVEVAIAAREFVGSAGCAFGWLYAGNGGGSTFSSFTTTGITTANGVLTAASGGNYILRITFNPTSDTDVIGYTIRIPTMRGGTGSTVTSIVASLV